MPRAKKTKKTAELEAQADPRAPVDSARLLGMAKPVLAKLEADLLERALASAAVTEVLKERHAAEVDAKHTADPFEVWQRSFVEQVAAAWVLGCVFVRTLEDRGLVERVRLAGPGAVDSQRSFFEIAPSLTERDYLLTVFAEMQQFPAVRDLFDTKHNPVWLVAPSGEACKALLELLRTPNADAPALRFGNADTRFLGDLYQDLNENVRDRFALLQTPRFIESFILDRTLEPAIEKFGLEETTIIDPTCGSGHFLLGAFERLCEHRLRAEPGLSPRQAAQKALAAVYGVDLNPYAVAIARFRLTLAFLDRGGFTKVAGAPEVHLNLAVADSLLHTPGETPTLGEARGQSALQWRGEQFALEDDAAAETILRRRHAAVVGNPPYVTVKDAAKRELYRKGYPRSAFRTYSVAAPFTECFFLLARDHGRVGMITTNSFMKREFGKPLIEKYLPTVNLDLVVNTSGAYIPGHGTPTVLLFGSAEPSLDPDVHVVLANRGEPETPETAEQGLVWSTIARHWDSLGFSDDFISVSRLARRVLATHPWCLAGGGASELKEMLERKADRRLASLVDLPIGRAARTGDDELFMLPPHVAARCGFSPATLRPLVNGEGVRDWWSDRKTSVIYPYDNANGLSPYPPDTPDAIAIQRHLWPWRTRLRNRTTFQGTMADAGLQYTASANRTLLSITFAEIATHNHFVLDRGGNVFNRPAPIVKLPSSATENDHLALLAYLNTSVVCFFLRQVAHQKQMMGADSIRHTDPTTVTFAFNAGSVASLPIPALSEQTRAHLADCARTVLDLAAERQKHSPDTVVTRFLTEDSMSDLGAALELAHKASAQAFRRMVAEQENLDWYVYSLWGLSRTPAAGDPQQCELQPGARPFALQLGESRNVDGWALPTRDDAIWHDETTVARLNEMRENRLLREVEQPQYKRRWIGRQGKFNLARDDNRDRAQRAFLGIVMNHVEVALGGTAAILPLQNSIRKLLGQQRFSDAATVFQVSEADVLTALGPESIPYLAALRLNEAGLEKWGAWLTAWGLQRREDRGDAVGTIPVPPKYEPADFVRSTYFALRGKLDVPKERFISYPGCESDEDRSPIYGWAGWNHLQRAQALAALYQDRKTREGWTKDRLTPMLAGLLELIPWVKQWHNEPSAEYDGQRLGDYFDAFLKDECRRWGLTEDDLVAWRPPKKGRARKAKAEEPAEETDA